MRTNLNALVEAFPDDLEFAVEMDTAGCSVSDARSVKAAVTEAVSNDRSNLAALVEAFPDDREFAVELHTSGVSISGAKLINDAASRLMSRSDKQQARRGNGAAPIRFSEGGTSSREDLADSARDLAKEENISFAAALRKVHRMNRDNS